MRSFDRHPFAPSAAPRGRPWGRAGLFGVSCVVSCAPPPSPSATPQPVVIEASDAVAPEPPPPARPVAEPAMPPVPFDAAEGDGIRCASRDAEETFEALVGLARARGTALVPSSAFGCRLLTAGESFHVDLVLGAGRCYAAVATAEDGEPTLTLRARFDGAMPPGLVAPVLAAGASEGTSAWLGEPACFRNPLPLDMPARIEVVASGEGLVAVSVLVDE